LRFLDPTGFIVIPVLFLPLVDVLMKAGISPLVIVAPLTVASAPFFMSYQNFWIAMSEGLTGGKAYDGKQASGRRNNVAVIVLSVWCSPLFTGSSLERSHSVNELEDLFQKNRAWPRRSQSATRLLSAAFPPANTSILWIGCRGQPRAGE